MSGWFSPLTAPLPFGATSRSAIRSFIPTVPLIWIFGPLRFPLRCNALFLCSHDCLCQYVRSALPTQMLFYVVLLYWQLQHTICTKSQDLALKISKIFRGYYPRTPKAGEGDPLPHPPPARPLAVRGGLRPRCCPRCRNPRFQKRSPKSKIATTPLIFGNLCSLSFIHFIHASLYNYCGRPICIASPPLDSSVCCWMNPPGTQCDDSLMGQSVCERASYEKPIGLLESI